MDPGYLYLKLPRYQTAQARSVHVFLIHLDYLVTKQHTTSVNKTEQMNDILLHVNTLNLNTTIHMQ